MIKQSRLARGIAKTQQDYIPFGFGLDLVTPSNQTKPGSLRSCKNVEININGGYSWGQGYERFDGSTISPPLEADDYYRIDVNITGILAVGNTVTDAITGATGKVIAINNQLYSDRDFIIITRKSVVDFGVGDTLLVGGTPRAETLSEQMINGAPTQQLGAYYKFLVAEDYRPETLVVPGSGPVLGVWLSMGTLYAVRNNVGGTAAVIHKTTASGWQALALGFELAFTSGGTTEIVEGDTITGLTSGATAVVKRVILEGIGTWGGGTAAGRLIFASQTGNFQAAEGLSITGGGGADLATLGGDSTPIVLLPGGRFEWEDYSFGGGLTRIYGCDGVNRGFEYEASTNTFVPLSTGMVLDAPKHLTIHKNHLFFAFGSSAQHSAIGDPYRWSPVLGAAELAVGDEITGFQVQPGAQAGGALAIASRNRLNLLYGSSAADWELVEFRKEVGAFPYSMQEFGITLMMDDRGVVALQAAQEYGNFSSSSVSKLVQPFVNSRKSLVTASCISREKSQYRVFFSDKTALYITTENNKVMGIMQQELAHVVSCVCSREDTDGSERIYFGSTNGMVYRMESGNSHDGAPIEREFTLHFHHSKSPRVEKSYFDASFEISGSGYSEFYFRYELDYNLSTTPQPDNKTVEASFSQAYWDSMVWDNFVWDGVILSPANVDMNGSGENISLIFASSSQYFDPVTFSGAQLRLAFRKQLRS